MHLKRAADSAREHYSRRNDPSTPATIAARPLGKLDSVSRKRTHKAMAAVANHHQPLPSSASTSNARNSPTSNVDHHRDMSASDASISAPPPPPASTAAPARGKAKKKSNGTGNDSNDAHKALLSKIHQLEASTTENAHEAAEIEAEVKKANRDLSQLLNTMEPHNSKLDAVQRRYTELLGEMKKVEREHVKAKKKSDQLQKDKEEIGKERMKEKGLKEKLEKLSRELTRENKKLKDDLRDIKEKSADCNEELQRKLEDMVLDVEEVIGDRRPQERQVQEMEQDKLFREKFTSFLHQYELRELQFQSVLRTKDLEIALQVARHDQLKKAQENELSKSHQLTRQVSTFSQTENELRGQLNVYVEKFKQVRLLPTLFRPAYPHAPTDLRLASLPRIPSLLSASEPGVVTD